MKAMLLAAGLGLRMRPLTLTQPKPALPILGRPLALLILERLRQSGVGEVVINLHHLPDLVRRLAGGDGSPTIPAVHYTEEPEILGTGGGLRNAAHLLRGAGPILACNSDSLSDVDLQAVIRRHHDSGHLATLVLAPPRPGYSEVLWDSADRVISLAGAPRVSPSAVAGAGLFTGCQVLSEEVLERIPAGRSSDIVRDVYRPLAAEGRLGAFHHQGFWWEFGSPALYLEGSLRLLDLAPRELDRVCFEHDAVRNIEGARVTLGAATAIHQTARLLGRVAIGFACQISAGAQVEESVVMPEAWVGPDCRLSRVVVGQGTELPEGFEGRNIVVCTDPGGTAELPEGTWRDQGLLMCGLDGGPG